MYSPACVPYIIAFLFLTYQMCDITEYSKGGGCKIDRWKYSPTIFDPRSLGRRRHGCIVYKGTYTPQRAHTSFQGEKYTNQTNGGGCQQDLRIWFWVVVGGEGRKRNRILADEGGGGLYRQPAVYSFFPLGYNLPECWVLLRFPFVLCYVLVATEGGREGGGVGSGWVPSIS